MATTREIMAELKRQRAFTGEQLSPRIAEEIVRGGMKAESDRAFQSKRLAFRERAFDEQMDLKRDALDEEALAGRIGAVAQVGSLYGNYKQNSRALDIAKMRAENEAKLYGGLFGADDVASAAGVAPGAAEGAAVEAALGPGTEAATSAATSAVRGSATAGAIGGLVGSQVVRAGGGNKYFQGAGAAAGSYLMYSNPYTAAIAGVITILGGDKVICGELNKHGYISDNVLALDCMYSLMYVDTHTHVGYRHFADKIVVVIRGNKLLRAIIAPFGIAWAHAMAEKVDFSTEIKYWHRYLGNFLMKTITPICRVVGRRLLNG